MVGTNSRRVITRVHDFVGASFFTIDILLNQILNIIQHLLDLIIKRLLVIKSLIFPEMIPQSLEGARHLLPLKTVEQGLCGPPALSSLHNCWIVEGHWHWTHHLIIGCYMRGIVHSLATVMRHIILTAHHIAQLSLFVLLGPRKHLHVGLGALLASPSE